MKPLTLESGVSTRIRPGSPRALRAERACGRSWNPTTPQKPAENPLESVQHCAHAPHAPNPPPWTRAGKVGKRGGPSAGFARLCLCLCLYLCLCLCLCLSLGRRAPGILPRWGARRRLRSRCRAALRPQPPDARASTLPTPHPAHSSSARYTPALRRAGAGQERALRTHTWHGERQGERQEEERGADRERGATSAPTAWRSRAAGRWRLAPRARPACVRAAA